MGNLDPIAPNLCNFISHEPLINFCEMFTKQFRLGEN